MVTIAFPATATIRGLEDRKPTSLPCLLFPNCFGFRLVHLTGGYGQEVSERGL